MTQWCGAAAGLLSVLSLLTAARYRAVTATLRERLADGQRENDLLRARLEAELADRSAENRAVQHEQELNAATRRAFLSVARRILVMAHDQQAGLDEMERTHDDPALLEGLLKADHAAAQQARLAQTLAVLCGARAGRHWPEPVPLEDVVRGAQSRILPFQRVVVRSRIETAVVGAAAEALIHAVAELLDNGTRYSPPSTQVFVTLMPVHNGVVIEIDDCGVGMSETSLERAAAALAGDGTLEVSRLGEVPQLGLAAVGRLAAQYGFRATLSSAPSPYGGVRVVVLLPNDLLTEPLPAGAGSVSALPTVPTQSPVRPTPSAHVQRSAPVPPAAPSAPLAPAGPAAPAAPFVPPAAERPRERAAERPVERPVERPAEAPPAGPAGLPRRTNRRPADPTPRRTATVSGGGATPPRSAREAQAFMALFQAGTASGRSAARRQQNDEPFPASPQLPQRSGDFNDHQS
ncbi:sensor histidine kinase [Kitasatospora camelliae]|uniref:histidine kinase n=1 Tax=Kitasatospora camelliae TaxID=3156397 RepID=A0AAU8K757_9ACTN